MNVPASLARDISPPQPLKRRRTAGISSPAAAYLPNPNIEPTIVAIEAGKAKIDDHLSYFKNHLAKSHRQTPADVARLSISDFATLYHGNENEHGRHFVIHQHNHPRAGVHYDLRLQFSKTSSMSFAVPKGLPGNPNSKSIGRMAIETRVHNYWNHLIESASSKTGSLLIWDTGTYEVLPRKTGGRNRKGMPSPQTTDDEETELDSDEETSRKPTRTTGIEHENDKLITAFQTRYIRLRLHGTRLPKNYTIVMRLPTNEIIQHPTVRRKSRHKPLVHKIKLQSDSEAEDQADLQNPMSVPGEEIDTDTDEDVQTRATNAYPGSTNDIGSIHQRHWFMQLDRQNSGFVVDDTSGGKVKWVRGPDGSGFEPFLVRGRDYERSVVTGRLAREVESDQGVYNFVGRAGWMEIEH
ncbi:hypothetical protein HBI73_002290 [Parastagonospora nodorum]|nr:hypothetical protein HBI06_091320 [Parastagonospora nodorum]KAH4249293.1 hypothetical protein HBI05_003280 [Parastagonospora nodorum]KAH5169904.1 hypothetical protein HBI73_002290 [Parastagonospora nodorum]KAH5477843.1 hypothetical protein HBI28_061770 [Parastagonospora nodorum]KAH5635696.1 hypothetical protein HBI22_090970 [Parastagonospora nodorum]